MAPRRSVDREVRRAILDARAIMQQAEKADSNEAETRRRIERLFESLMGYDVFKHLSRERAVRGAGETEHVDFSIQLEAGDSARPLIMVEIKRVAIDLAKKHLKQVASYAIDAGCEWALLTNGREWRLHHVDFGQPPETREVRTWNLMTDETADLADSFDLISLRSLKRKSLNDLWQKTNVLQPRNLLEAMVSEASLNAIRRELRRKSKILLPPEDVVSGIRRVLNEAALAELEGLRISLPIRRPARKSRRKSARSPTDSGTSANGNGVDDCPPVAEE